MTTTSTKEKAYLEPEEILNLIRSLACSQGMYGRMLEGLNDIKEADPSAYEELLDSWRNRFRTDLDFILYVEQ